MDIISNQVIERCQNGDKSAFRIVVQTYQRMVFALSLRLLCDEEEAKDVVQETMIRVWLNIGKYNPNQSLRTWIYTIATRLALDRLKHREWTEPMPEEEEYFSQYIAEEETDRQLENRELIAIIRTLVNKLSPKQRLVFTLVHFENLSTAEVTQITDLDADKIKSNLYVARKTLREQLKRLGYE